MRARTHGVSGVAWLAGACVAVAGCGDDSLGGRLDGAATDSAVVETADSAATETEVAPDSAVETSDLEVAKETSDTPETVADTTPDTVPDPDTGDSTDTVDSTDTGDTTVVCTPNPFAAPYAASDWRHSVETGVLTVLQGAARHRGQDVLVEAGQPQRLIAKFAYGALDKDLKDEDVEVFYQPAPPCGAWASLGTFATSNDGDHGTLWGITDDGGRLYVEVPEAKRLPVGVYPIRMLVKGDLSVAAFTLWVTDPHVTTVITDIDGTLTTSDFELITQLFTDLLSGSYVPAPYPDGQPMLWSYRNKGYQIVYVTGRPDFLRAITQTWLIDEGYPPGAVHLTDTNAQALPADSGVAAYKTDFLNKVMAEAEADLFAAYGNALTDIHAYANVAIHKNRTYIIGTNAGQEGTVAIDTYTNHLPTAQAAPAPSVPGPKPPDVNQGWW